MGGMTRFVENGWAGKDYTHINYAGGREIARQLYYGLLQGAQNRSRTLRQRMEDAQPVLPERELEITEPELNIDTLITIEL
jgi:hypothetical protein